MDHSILHSLTAPVGFLATEASYLDQLKELALHYMSQNPLQNISEGLENLLGWSPLEYAMGTVIMIPVLIAYTMINLSVFALEMSLHTNINSDILFKGWEMSMYLVNIFAVFILIFIAFANALRINIETYEIKKTLPNFVVSIILANLSFLIVKFLLDFSDILLFGIQEIFKSKIGLAAQIMNVTTGIQFVESIKIGDIQLVRPAVEQSMGFINTLIAGTFLASLPFLAIPGLGTLIALTMQLLLVLVLMIPAFLITFLAIICLARNIVLFILIALMPIIIILYFFPPTKQHGQKLLGEFFQWLFLGPAIYFILGLATLFGSANLVSY